MGLSCRSGMIGNVNDTPQHMTGHSQLSDRVVAFGIFDNNRNIENSKGVREEDILSMHPFLPA